MHLTQLIQDRYIKVLPNASQFYDNCRSFTMRHLVFHSIFPRVCQLITINRLVDDHSLNLSIFAAKIFMLYVLATIVTAFSQWELLLIKSDQFSKEEGVKEKQSPLSVRPLSDTSSIVLPAVSIAASETSAFTGVPPFPNSLHHHDNVMTTPNSSPSRTSCFSEDDFTDSPLHHGNGCYNNNTISFAKNYQSKQAPSLLVTVDVHTQLDNSVAKNMANSSSIMTPVNETASPQLLQCSDEDLESSLLDSWNEAELLVPGTPDVLLSSGHVSDTLTATTGKATSSYKDTSSFKDSVPSSACAKPKPNRLSGGAVQPPLVTKPVKGKNMSVRKKRRSQQLLADISDSSVSDIIPPASVTTAPGLKPWQSTAKKISNPIVAMPTVLQSGDPLVSMTTTRSSELQSPFSILATNDNGVMIGDHRILPVSNSPIDIIIMLSRMAAFCSSMTKVLSPKLPVNASLPTKGNVY